MENLKKVFSFQCSVFSVLILLALQTRAADLTRGITFTDGQRLTAAQLHSLVDSASIGTAFLTGKSLMGTVDGADYVLVYDTSTGTFKKMTLATLIMANTDLITTQSDETAPAANDYLLMYNASGSGLVKVSVASLVTGNTNLIAAQPLLTNALQTAMVGLLNGGTNVQMQLAHLWAYNFNYTRAITNLTEHTAPTNTDKVLLFDSTAGTNKWGTLIGLITNLPATTNPTNTASLWLAETGQLKQATIETLRTSLTQAAFLNTNQTFTTSAACSGITGASKPIDAAHGLGVTPRSVAATLVCTTANLNYSIGDEVIIDAAWTDPASAAPVFTFLNSTNVGCVARTSAATWQIANKTTGTLSFITAGSWSLKVTARP